MTSARSYLLKVTNLLFTAATSFIALMFEITHKSSITG